MTEANILSRWRAFLRRHPPLYTMWSVGVAAVVVPITAAGVLFYALFFGYFFLDIIRSLT